MKLVEDTPQPKRKYPLGATILVPIKDPVGNGMLNHPDDVRRVKAGLDHIGLFDRLDDTDQDTPDNPILTRKMDDAIKMFQRDNGLKVDGKLNPGGETERALSTRIAQADPMVVKPKKKPQTKDEPPKPTRKPKRTTSKDNPYGYDEDILKSENTLTEKDATGRRVREDVPKKAPPIPKRRPEAIEPTKKGDELLELIGQLESSNNYNIIAGGDEKPLTKMTMKEIIKLQRERNNHNLNTAVGKYQIIDEKMNDLIKWMNISENQVFDKKMQDSMGRELLRRRGFEKYKAGKMNTDDFILKLAQEWAAFPKDPSDQSYYDGIGNNKALIKFEELKRKLEKE